MMAEFDEFERNYHELIDAAVGFSGKSHDFFTQAKGDYLERELTRHFGASPGQPLNILDVGCGHGDVHKFLEGRSPPHKLTGVDVAGDVLKVARSRYPGNCYDVYGGTTLPYETGSFDAAFTICVMHHVLPAQWLDFLREMRRVVRPGGLAIIVEHNPLNPMTRRIVNNCPIDANAVLLGSGQLRKLAAEAGFEDTASRYVMFVPFAGAFWKGLERALGWLPFGAQYYVTARR